MGPLDGIHDLNRRNAEVDAVAVIDPHDAQRYERESQVHAGAADEGQVAVFDVDRHIQVHLQRHFLGGGLDKAHAGKHIGVDVLLVSGHAVRICQIAGLGQTVGGKTQVELVACAGDQPHARLNDHIVAVLIFLRIAVCVDGDVDRFAVLIENGIAVFIRQFHALRRFREVHAALEGVSGVPFIVHRDLGAVYRLIYAFVYVVLIVDHELYRKRCFDQVVVYRLPIFARGGIVVALGLDRDRHGRRLTRYRGDERIVVDLIPAGHRAGDRNIVEDL